MAEAPCRRYVSRQYERLLPRYLFRRGTIRTVKLRYGRILLLHHWQCRNFILAIRAKANICFREEKSRENPTHYAFVIRNIRTAGGKRGMKRKETQLRTSGLLSSLSRPTANEPVGGGGVGRIFVIQSRSLKPELLLLFAFQLITPKNTSCHPLRGGDAWSFFFPVFWLFWDAAWW